MWELNPKLQKVKTVKKEEQRGACSITSLGTLGAMPHIGKTHSEEWVGQEVAENSKFVCAEDIFGFLLLLIIESTTE